ncbi:hypothetical protein K9B35_19870 [Sphingomonas sp. R647]|uniref:hypothetical protein n=1 Tax=Sphingomonas sp. R647 TaxID=2875233 RepID=UPI001CD5010F|nr:hypothetical protein [Sphingomonas sp. R647]MCA1200231.1 hypothetical protein [Sphingomonas sp. R647]
MKSLRIALFAGAFILSGCAPQEFASGSCPNTLSGWRTPGEIGHQVPAYFVTIESNGEILTSLWNGYRMSAVEKTSRQALRQLIQRIPVMLPEPIVILKPAPKASCGDVEAIRAEIDAKLDCKTGRCGEGSGWYELSGMPLIA